jgi:protocatechuate 3,4-dioxygenase beta subunit
MMKKKVRAQLSTLLVFIIKQLKMNRKSFLKGVGLATTSTLIPFRKLTKTLNAAAIGELSPVACTLIPTETAGPFPTVYSTTNQNFLLSTLTRTDIRVNTTPNPDTVETGVLLTLTVVVQNLNCTPVPNARVDIWHASKVGVYSGYNNGMNPGDASANHLRGSYTTDSNGRVTFTTVYPGWYNGRLPHIHLEVFIGGISKRVSQFAFPLYSLGAGTATYDIFNAGLGYSVPNGSANNTYASDNVFSNGVTEQLLTLTGSPAAGYASTHTFILDTPAAMPLSLVAFVAGTDGNNRTLWWTTASEINVSHFTIERSTHPSKGFESIGEVAAKNATGTHHYSLIDYNPPTEEVSYYRLKIVDIDGTVDYSKVVTVNNGIVKTMSISPNPATTDLIIKHPKANNNSLLKIISAGGHLMATGTLQKDSTATQLDVSSLTQGFYFLIIESGIDQYVFKFLKK